MSKPAGKTSAMRTSICAWHSGSMIEPCHRRSLLLRSSASTLRQQGIDQWADVLSCYLIAWVWVCLSKSVLLRVLSLRSNSMQQSPKTTDHWLCPQYNQKAALSIWHLFSPVQGAQCLFEEATRPRGQDQAPIKQAKKAAGSDAETPVFNERSLHCCAICDTV